MFSTHDRPERGRMHAGPEDRRHDAERWHRRRARHGGPFGPDFGPPAGGPRGRRGGPFGRPGGPGRDDADGGPEGPFGGGPFGGDGPFGGRGPFGPGGPHGRGGRGRGRGGRRSRGDVRLAVLALVEEAPMHGYQIIQEIAERSGGSWRPSPGSVYPTVSQLADEGLVRTEKSEGRSVVHLTEEGTRWCTEHRAELDAVWTGAAADDGFSDLRGVGRALAGAVAQVAKVGTPDQVTEATRLLDETRRRLYLLLAGETVPGTPEARDTRAGEAAEPTGDADGTARTEDGPGTAM